MQLKIPVTATNRQFIEWKENLSEVPNRTLTELSFVGMLLDRILTDEDTYSNSKLVESLDDYNDVIVVQLAVTAEKEGRLFLPDYAIIYFNLMIHRFMHEVLLERVLDRDSLGISQSETILDFMDDLKLTHVTYDTLRKAQYRIRVDKKIGSLRLPRKILRYKKKLRKRIVNTTLAPE